MTAAALACAALAGLAGTGAWLARSEAGSRWLLGRVPGLVVDGLQGSLLGERLSASRLRWAGDAGTLEIENAALDGLQWQWRPAPAQWIGLRWDRVSAARVHWRSSDAPGAPLQAPRSLRLPLALGAPMQVGSLQIDALPPIQDLQATLTIGAEGGARHRVDALALRWDRGELRGQMSIGADAPLAVDATLDATSLETASPRWSAQMSARGPLERFEAAARLQGQDDATRLDARGTVRPFAAFPLTALALRTEALDLSRLLAAAPITALSGEAHFAEPTPGTPLRAQVQIANALPGRWEERRLPLREARFALDARLDAPDRLTLSDLQLRLGDATGDAGSARGNGHWHGHGAALELQLEGVVPQRLDGRAPAWRVDGALGMTFDGLPSPDPAAAAPASPWSLVAALALAGRDAQFPDPVRLQGQLRATPGTLQVERLQARAGDAEARLAGTLQQRGSRWNVSAEGTLLRLDPARWWPGLGEAWRRGPNLLSGELALALELPARATAAPTDPARWRQAQGQARLRVDDGLLAGVPVKGRLSLDAAGEVLATATLGGNQVNVGARFDPSGADDRWQFALQAPDLATLAPLSRLHPALADLPSAGQVQAQGEFRGRWPQLAGNGSASLKGVRSGPLQLGSAELRWRAGSSADEPLAMQIAASQLRWREQQVPTLEAELSGTLASHRLRFEAALPLVPPEALARSLALDPQRGTRVVASAEGSLTHDGGGLQWRGGLRRLAAGAWDGRLPLTRPAPREWLDMSPVQAEFAVDPDGRLLHLRADGGRLRLADELDLVWKEVRYEGGALALQATVEGFRVAPLLARWQPNVGWEGDLRIGASLAMTLDARTQLDVVVERLGGDLAVREAPDRSVPLGLGDMRLALQAQDGTWLFSQGLAGRTLGELGGVIRVRSDPAARWPDVKDPLDGTLAGRVANLGIWGAWVPPGWRLQGSLQTEVQFGGRLGAPELRGELRGDALGVRNLLQGVHVQDGMVRIRLEGEHATVDRFLLRAGDGTLRLSGGAQLGAAPRAELVAEADRFQVLSRIDRRLAMSGNAALVLAPGALTLRGKLGVDEGLFDASRADAPTLDDDVVIRRAEVAEGTDAAAAAARKPLRTDVAVDVDFGERLRVRGRGLDTRLTGAVRLSAPGGRLAIHGRVQAADGTYAAYAQKLEIERGELVFAGEPGNPRLDILALRPNLDIEVGVAITGNALSPRVRLHSSPEMSESDKLSWLVLGRDPGGLGRSDTALLQRAAVALLAGENEAPTTTLMRNLGLDEFSVRQNEDGTGAGDTIVSLGKQLSRRWYVGYERSVNATTGTWQLIYRVAQRFTVRAQSGAENSLDAIWVWRVP